MNLQKYLQNVGHFVQADVCSFLYPLTIMAHMGIIATSGFIICVG